MRAFHPGARRVQAIDPRGQVMAELAPVGRTGLFHGRLPDDAPDADGRPGAYRLRVIWPAGAGHEAVQEAEDPYAFGLLLGDLDLHLIAEGRHWELARCLVPRPCGRTMWPACALPCGHPMPGACRWSATSTSGTAAATRCGCATAPACGSCSCPPAWARARARATSSSWWAPTGICWSRPTRWHAAPKRRPRPPRWWPIRCRSDGPTRRGWKPAPRASGPMRRSPSTRCTRARGCATWKTAAAAWTGTRWASG